MIISPTSVGTCLVNPNLSLTIRQLLRNCYFSLHSFHFRVTLRLHYVQCITFVTLSKKQLKTIMKLQFNSYVSRRGET